MKYTFDEIKQEFDNRGYELVSGENDFKNAKSKMKYICPKHKDKGILEISVSHFMHGQGCKWCGIEKNARNRTKDFDKVEDKLLAESKDFTYIDTHRENSIVYIDFICNKHKEFGVQSMRKANMKRDIKGCKYCDGQYLPEWYVMQKKEEINSDIILIDPYEKMMKRMLCYCKKHDCYTYKTMQKILNGEGCKFCGLEKLSKQKTLDDKTIEENVHKKNPHVNLIKYNGGHEISDWYCTKHDRVFQKLYFTLIDCKSGCEECYRENIRERDGMGQDEFLRRLKDIHPELKLVGEYINNSEKIEFYCEKHDYSFFSTPANILGRLSCCPKSRVTFKEERVCSLLENWGFKIVRQKEFDGCVDIENLKFDCYLDDFNIAVEYDGEQHYRPVKFGEQSYESALEKYEYTKRHDEIKNNYCDKNNIKLIRIPYYEFDDLEYFLFDKLVEYGAIEEIKAS